MQAFREMLKAEAKGDTYSLPPRDQLLGSVSRGPPAAALNKVLAPVNCNKARGNI